MSAAIDDPNGMEAEQAETASTLLLAALFFLFSFFPYISFVSTSTDLQPYALIISLVILGAGGVPRNLPRHTWLLAIAPLAAFSIWLSGDFSYFGFRESLTFLSPLTIAIATFAVLQLSQGREMLRWFVVVTTYVWLAVGLAELFYGPTLVAPLIPNLSFDQTRGVPGLATEPSFYGLHCICLLALNYLCNNNSKLIAALLIFQIIFVAQSSIAVVMLFIFMFYALLFLPSLKAVTMTIGVAIAAIWLSTYLQPRFQDARIVYLFLTLLSDPSTLVSVDVSLNARVGHVVFSILGFIDSLGMPHGFNHFYEYALRRADTVSFVWLGSVDPNKKIMSGYGSELFEIGIFGLFTPLGVAIAIACYFRHHLRQTALVVLYVTTVMFFAIQVSLPLLGVLIGWILSNPRRPAVDPA